MIRTTTLESGLQVTTEEVADVQSVALSFWVGTGSRDETESEAGMSHFLEHLLCKGSETRGALEIAQAIDGVGGDMNAFTTKESTAFYVRVLSQDVELALDILCDIICSPAFDPRELEAERQVVLEEMLMRGDDPADLAHEHAAEELFAGHPLGREILGDRQLIETMSVDAIRAFFKHHYRPKNMVFAAAGRLEHDATVDAIRSRWRNSHGGERPQREAPVTKGGVVRLYRRPTDQAHIVLAVPAPNRHDHDRYAASLIDAMLGGGMSSRLFQEVREKRGLAYSVYSSYGPSDDTGEMSIYLGTAPTRVSEALDVVVDEVARFRDDGVTDAELDRAKRHLHATTLLNLEDTTARMSRIGRSLLQHGDILSIEEVVRRVDAVTVDDIARVAKQILGAEPVLVGVGPIKEADLRLPVSAPAESVVPNAEAV